MKKLEKVYDKEFDIREEITYHEGLWKLIEYEYNGIPCDEGEVGGDIYHCFIGQYEFNDYSIELVNTDAEDFEYLIDDMRENNCNSIAEFSRLVLKRYNEILLRHLNKDIHI